MQIFSLHWRLTGEGLHAVSQCNVS